MTDPASYRLSRSPSFMNRPAQSPMGPRTRFPRSAASSPDIASSRESFLLSPLGEPSPMYPLSPATPEPVLPAISEQEPPELPPPPITSPPPPPTLPYQPPAFKVIPKQAMLARAPAISFESVPVAFKSLPLEGFLWTLNNSELQEMVSRAIRSSARESFVRLLSLENLDHAMPAEVERLDSLKMATQAKYRFLVHRRTMLLQALNSSSLAPEKTLSEDGVSTVSNLAMRLSETTAECDQVMELLLQISDQLAQMSKMVEVHWAGALAIALRKLNKSYARRTAELLSAREKIAQLEADLEDAWKEAAQIAQEMDDYDATIGVDSDDDIEEAVIETAEKVTVPKSQRASKVPDLVFRSRRNTAQMDSLPLFSPLSPMPRMSTIKSPLSPDLPQLEDPPMTPPHQDISETASIRSTRSGKSTKSARSGRSTRSTRTPNGTRLSLLSAAKTRSQRVSKGSLRLPKVKTPVHPPVPELPLEFAPSPLPPVSTLTTDHPLWPDRDIAPLLNAQTSPTSNRVRRTSLDDIRPPRRSSSSYTPTVTRDDIHVRPQPRRPSEEIQTVLRTPPPRPQVIPEQPSQTIPSMWLMSETAPKAATVKRTGSTSSSQTYSKLKTLSKRYSLPFPLFKNKSRESQLSSKSYPGRNVGH